MHGQRIRLHGIDAPEASQLCDLGGKPWRCGQASANALAEYIGGRTVTCEPRPRDRYGCLVAACSVGGASISARMVREGWAVAYRRYSQDFVADEAAASHRSGCDIKGNINSKGERIYHVPGVGRTRAP